MSQLPISNRTVMLDVNGVRAARGISADQVNELVEAGELLWVFNLGRGHGERHIRNLRFWAPEIADAGAVAGLSLESALAKILPATRTTFNGAEVSQWFLVSRPTVQRIGRRLNGVVKSRVLQVGRAPLANYLRERWIGGGK